MRRSAKYARCTMPADRTRGHNKKKRKPAANKNALAKRSKPPTAKKSIKEPRRPAAKKSARARAAATRRPAVAKDLPKSGRSGANTGKAIVPAPVDEQRVLLRVNKEEHELLVPAHRTLAEVLRDDLHLTGTKESCSEGACGTCTVLIDGLPVRSCLLLAIEAEGKEITTIEGLAEGGKLHPIQEAFVEHFAIQCGFCTPGMILTAKALLDTNPQPTEKEIRDAISGNVCRCTGYAKIVEAIQAASGTPGSR